MSIWEGVNADEVRELMQQDPFIQNGVFVIEDLADDRLRRHENRVIHARTGLGSR
jgi:hypothetical protein